MAFSAGGSSGGLRGRRRFGSSNGTLSEINIVPLVDVVLVLLIIFMLTAHVMDYGLKVDVPKVRSTQETNEVLPTVTISSDSKLQLNKVDVNINKLATEIARRFKDQKKVYIAADASVRWNVVANVTAELGAAKYEILYVTKPLEAKGR